MSTPTIPQSAYFDKLVEEAREAELGFAALRDNPQYQSDSEYHTAINVFDSQIGNNETEEAERSAREIIRRWGTDHPILLAVISVLTGAGISVPIGILVNHLS